MASNYTSNYNLCQWEATDQVVHTDFNEDNQKVDAALANMLQHCEFIRAVTMEASGRQLKVLLDDIDWDTWEFVVLTMMEKLISANSMPTLQLRVNDDSVPCCNSANTGGMAIVDAMPFLLLLLPLRDSSRQLRYVYIGEPSGVGIGECTFAELQNILIVYASTQSSMPKGTSVQLWGIR